MDPVQRTTTPDDATQTSAGDRPREKASTERIRIEQHGFTGMLWFGGWLFALGFLHLPFWKGVLAILLWPYFLGIRFGLPPG